MFSGGVGSWAAARRVYERHGSKGLTLLFTDTLMEDEDLYRFLDEAASDVHGQLVKIADGRTPWEVFNDRRFLGNTRVDLCSRILKRELAQSWLDENCDQSDTVVYVGIDWTEEHRFTRMRDRYAEAGWRYEAPLCEEPYQTKQDAFAQLKSRGIKPPRLYAMGFAHNNCGGFCVKAGHGHFATLLRQMPERYAHHEQKERDLRDHLGKDVAILRDRTGGDTKPLTMEAFRRRVQGGGQVDMFDIGGCGCFTE